ncbi:MAG: glycosyltransferase N-terminal domain-containing protein, partial [Verrucomicrobiota bacterium]
MRLIFGLAIYRLLLPLLFLAAFPGWIVKMLRRGGCGTRLGERVARYAGSLDADPRGAVHLHAVSVGEAMLALKLIREWHLRTPEQPFVLATGTATGHAVATTAQLAHVRVTYAPLDFPSMVRRYLRHFAPSQIILIEGEAWPNLLVACRSLNLPVSLVNARLSPRSAARYRRFAAWVRPVFGMLDALAIQDPEDAAIWQQLGVAAEKIHATGSLKIDPGSGQPPTRQPEFQALLDALAGPGRPIILAASTHAGEEPWIASAIRHAVPDALILIAPRHA